MTPSRDCKVDSIINRYYDPTTDQFLSIDPDVAQTDQPYMFTNDNPLNTEDPLGEDPMLLGNPNQYPDQTVPIATVYSSGPIALTWMNSDGGGDAQLADGYSGTGGPAPAAGPGSEGTGGDGPDQTVHGEEQSADPSRLSKSQQADVIKNSTETFTQKDGADVYVQQVGEKYNVVVQNETTGEVVTNFKTISKGSLNRLANNYGWTPK